MSALTHNPTPEPPSFTMATLALTEQCDKVRELRTEYETAMDTRDHLIRQLITLGLSRRRVSIITGLSRTQLDNIRNQSPRHPAPGRD